ncbi:MAG: GNAT family N-acetyltransferase, partial [Flammeovirgaceae bacterium]
MQYSNSVIFFTANSSKEFNEGKQLFQLYAKSLNIDLCFQNFEKELQEVHIQYNLPTGALILALHNQEAIGCVGVRFLEPGICELKRMFVLPEFRKMKIGRQLLDKALDAAKRLGYRKIRLDTLTEMVPAQKLYRANGFYEVPPYYG